MSEKVSVPKEGLSIKEAAEYAGVSRHIMDAIVHTGCIPCIRVGKVGGKVIILKSTLQQFLIDSQGLTLSDDPAVMRATAAEIKRRRGEPEYPGSSRYRRKSK